MYKEMKYQGHTVCFHDEGKGAVLIFLHGFLESHEIWKDFSSALSGEFRIIAIDLPGHGRSDVISDTHTMELMADCVHEVLKSLSVEKCLIVGHSMGGYVALSFAGNFPEMTMGLCLFHSHALPDSEIAKTNRAKTIEIVENNRAGFITAFIPDLFSPVNIHKHKAEIRGLIKNASATSKEGIIAALKGMKNREGKMHVLARSEFPVLFIAGKDDKRIPLHDIFAMAALPDHAEVMILGNTGHMGYIEEKEKTIRRIRTFAEMSFTGNQSDDRFY